MKKRPTIEDRDLANLLRNLAPGAYSIDVVDTGATLRHFGLARLKVEGAIDIEWADKRISIVPVMAAKAAA